jgi:lysozyme family protein
LENKKRCAANVTDDGIIGPVTLSAIANLLAKEIAIATIHEREKYYHELAESTLRFRQYLIGWLRRTQALKLAIS